MPAERKQLSIIIPVYNWDTGLLVKALTEEIRIAALAESVEILIADDCSDNHFQVVNRDHVHGFAYVKYYELGKNIGRAAIRNDLLSRARGTYILFLDADVVPDSPRFLRTYIQYMEKGTPVVCGGISYRQRILKGRQYDFYLYKGTKTEWIPAGQRQLVPWRYFFSANVLLKADVLEEISFDERFSGYGYEDIEWGIRLEEKHGILHIDNTCSHLGLVAKDAAFTRMRNSIDNFIRLKRRHPQVFAKAGISSIATFLGYIPSGVLRILDAGLGRAFRFSIWPRLSYYCFQMDKAVLFSLQERAEAERGSADG
jgi:glycosyltransferase involved in cell wall biosynthesis